jgi:hypothetical protein
MPYKQAGEVPARVYTPFHASQHASPINKRPVCQSFSYPSPAKLSYSPPIPPDESWKKKNALIFFPQHEPRSQKCAARC